MYFAAAMAVGSMLASNSQRNAQMKAKVADAKLQRAKLERARLRTTEDYVANSQRAREAAQQREIQIESNRLDAESKVDTTFAGSGISGQSISEIDAELNASVVKNKIENKVGLEQQLGDISRNYSSNIEDTAEAASSIDTSRIKGNVLGELAVGASAFSSASQFGSSLSGSSPMGAKVSSFLGFN